MAKPGSRAFRLRGVVGIAILVPTGGAAILTDPIVPWNSWGSVAFDSLALVFLTAGLWLRLSSILFVGGRKGRSLVTNGPYSMCRNPLYLGTLMISFALAMFLHSFAMLGAALLVGIFYFFAVIPAEEGQLAALFPVEWSGYVFSVPRLLPRKPWWKAGQETLEVNLAPFRNESLRTLGMMAIPFFTGILNFTRVQEWWPKFGSLP